MNAVTPTTALIVADEAALAFVADPKVAVAVLTAEDDRRSFLASVKADLATFEPDVSTARGRDEIKAKAFKVTKTKTFIDATRKALTEEHRRVVDATNAAGRVIWDELEALAIETRRPLTEWEQAEKARVETIATTMQSIERSTVVLAEDAAADLRQRLAAISAMEFDPAVFGDSQSAAEEARAKAVEGLTSSIARLEREEADRAELDRLRQEAAARAEQDRVEREARVAAEKAAEEAKAAQEREAEIARKAAEDAKAEAARQAERALAAQAKAHQDELDRLARVEADRLAEEKRLADEAAERERDRAHKSKIMGAAKAAIVAHGDIDAEAAAKIVKAIAAKAIPNISISF